MRNAVLAAILLLIGCGDQTESSPRTVAEQGAAPVYLDANHPAPAFDVETGYGWTVLHCVDVGANDGSRVDVCADASSLYQTHNGRLCGPAAVGASIVGDRGSVQPLPEGCKVESVEFARWVRIH